MLNSARCLVLDVLQHILLSDRKKSLLETDNRDDYLNVSI